ncbi:hypothetical protein, partial [Pseudomonas lundensis]|uniref:hypothetical protein n=1 Tax=Pseudomonas lundensis TaxID=86185 RepID=UPI001CA3B977
SQRLSLKEHHHNGDALLGTQVVVLGRHGNTLHEVLHLLLETAYPLGPHQMSKCHKGVDDA